MSKNRIIHNVQDVFVGSLSDETNDLVVGVEGSHVLQRVERVQSFSYDITTSIKEDTFLGKTHYVARSYNEPSQISLDLSYYSYGVNNEQRFGLNVDADTTCQSELGKNVFHYMALNETVGRNIYLVVNNKTEDIHHGNDTPYPDKLMLKEGFQESDVIDPNAKDYSVVVFQNCYLDSYNVVGSIGQLTSIDMSFAADNMIAYSSASGINIPYLDLKKGEVTNTVASVYTSDFYTTWDGWSEAGTTLSTPAAYGGELDPLKITATAPVAYHRSYKDIGTVAGKKYKITAKINIKSGGANIRGFQFRYANGTSTPIIHPTLDTWYNFSYEYTAADNGNYDGWIEFWMANSSSVDTSSTFSWAGGTNDYFHLKDVVVTEVKEFIIPNHFNRSESSCFDDEKLLSKPAGITVEIYRSSSEGIDFQTSSIQNFSLSCPVSREPLDYAAYKMYAGRPVVFPLESQLSITTISNEIPVGSLIDNINSEDEYNIVINCEDEDSLPLVKYTISNAKFLSKSNNSAIGENTNETLNFSTSMDFGDTPTKGVFVSGVVNSVCADMIWHNDNDGIDYDLQLSNGDDIIYGGALYPRF